MIGPSKKPRPEETEAYKQATAALDRFMKSRLQPAFDRIVSTMRTQFEKCINATEMPPKFALEVAYQRFIENIERLKPKMLGETEAAMQRWLERGEEIGLRAAIMRQINDCVENVQSNLTIKGLEARGEMSDRIDAADKAWRITHPEISASFPTKGVAEYVAMLRGEQRVNRWRIFRHQRMTQTADGN